MIKFNHFLAAMALAGANLVQGATGFSVSGAKLLDANGNQFLFRGINFPYAWYPDQLAASIPAIAATGANSVRVVMATGGQWSRTPATAVRTIISTVKANKMISVLEVHDCTGYGENVQAKPMSTSVDYWLSGDIKAELDGQEAYVILNIANEPYGNKTSAATYVAETKAAISRLRSGGYKHTLMIDATNWGQDWQGTMKNNAKSIIAADPLKNTLLSVHMYEVYNTESKVNSYLKAFSSAGLPLVVGEFADHSDNTTKVAAEPIMRLCQKYGIGYLGWSWKGNSSGLDALDIAKEWGGSALTTWGNLLINNANGINTTSKPASVFSPFKGPNLIQNGDFSAGTANWGTLNIASGTNAAATVSFSSGKAVVNVSKAGTQSWHVQLSQSGIALVSGTTYTLTFDASASVARSINLDFSYGANRANAALNWMWLGGGSANLTTTTQTYSVEVTPSVAAPAGVVQFGFGASASTVTIDNVSLTKKAAIFLPRSADLSESSLGTAINGSKFSVRLGTNGFEWVRSAPLATSAIVRVVDVQGHELYRATANAGSTTGSVPDVGSGMHFVVLETAQERDVRSLTSPR